jgi:hypothetical protein
VENFNNQAAVPSGGDINEPVEKSINAGYDIPNNPPVVEVGEAVPSGRIQYPL